MAAAEVDVGFVAGNLGLDLPALQAVTTNPTAELVATLLQAVQKKLHEYDELYSSKLQVDIEYEAAVRSAESRSQTSKSTVDKALKDTEEARQKLKEEGRTTTENFANRRIGTADMCIEDKRQALENELRTAKAKETEHDGEVKSLHDKIETLEASNRTNLSIIDSHNKRDESLTEELTKQHQRNVELSRELTASQQAEQNAKGQLTSAKYRMDSLQQQLDHKTRNEEWLEQELKTKSEEALKTRKEKGAKIAELQRQNEDAKAAVDAAKRTEEQLRSRVNIAQAKADEYMVKLQTQ